MVSFVIEVRRKASFQACDSIKNFSLSSAFEATVGFRGLTTSHMKVLWCGTDSHGCGEGLCSLFNLK